MLQTIDVSQARRNLSSLMDRVYFAGEKFVLLRRGIPMAVIMSIRKIEEIDTISLPKKKVKTELFGLWKRKKRSTVNIANSLRKKAWETHVG